LFVVVVEEFVVRVFKGGKVTVPKRLRELFGVEDGDYVRLGLVEVLKRSEGGWVRRKVG
jgi:bifunctional DNA-binding transcriptional regulator/antitoxin component of YhaV-PrlF toxin-antitoxin module